MTETPPTIYDNSFTNGHYIGVVLYVPVGCLNIYQDAENWSNFWDIREFDTIGICDVKTENKNATTVYDLNGRVVETPTKGNVYIKNGKKVRF
ncbi:MAG: hypothetical protein IKY85_05820 [Bacteroidaceae bacterium]|nr:hypothetical protein [Bacteroidaceae bacterium]